MKRRAVLAFVATISGSAFAQRVGKRVELKSIGVGSFEFPLAGEYEVERQGAATIFNLVGGDRTITVGLLRKPPDGLSSRADQLHEAEVLLRRNWLKFANGEGGIVTSPFMRIALSERLALMAMATEFQAAGRKQHYLNYAVTDGTELVSLTVEGPGSADIAERDVGPFIRAVQYAPRSN